MKKLLAAITAILLGGILVSSALATGTSISSTGGASGNNRFTAITGATLAGSDKLWVWDTSASLDKNVTLSEYLIYLSLNGVPVLDIPAETVLIGQSGSGQYLHVTLGSNMTLINGVLNSLSGGEEGGGGTWGSIIGTLSAQTDLQAALDAKMTTATFDANVDGAIDVAAGGTGAKTAAAARTALGLETGANVQAWNAMLDNFSSFTDPDADKLIYWNDYFNRPSSVTIDSTLSFTGGVLSAPLVSNATYDAGTWGTDATHAPSKAQVSAVIEALPGGHDAVTIATPANGLTVDGNQTISLAAATTSQAGTAELATNAEVAALSDNATIVTPAGLGYTLARPPHVGEVTPGLGTFTTATATTFATNAADRSHYMRVVNSTTPNYASPQEGDLYYDAGVHGFKYYNGSSYAAFSSAIADSGVTFIDVETGNSSTTAHGYLKKLDNNAAHYMNGQGNWGGISVDLAAATLFDAKGDLIVGTADNTAARLAVGANGTIPTAASGETSGIKWTTTTWPATASQYTVPVANTANAITQLALTANTVLGRADAGIVALATGTDLPSVAQVAAKTANATVRVEPFIFENVTAGKARLFGPYPTALVLDGLYCTAVGGGSVAVSLQECDSGAANCADVGASVTANGGVDSDTSLTDASIAAGAWMNIILGTPTGTVTYLSCGMEYHY